MPATPVVATFPRDDLVFAGFVRSCLAEGAPALEPTALQAALRRWHTRAIVREKTDLAGFGWGQTWYAYRDGRAGIVADEQWWLEPACAHVGFGRDGRFMVANGAADDLVDRGGGLVGAHWSDLLAPEAVSAQAGQADFLWDLLDGGSVAQSVFDLPLADGRRRVIEYRSVRCPEGGYESWWRELATIDASVAA